MTADKIIGIVLFTIALLWVTRPFLMHRQEVWQGLKGDNDRLDIPEMVALGWLMLFPVLALAEVFLDFKAGQTIWYSMDFVMITIMGGRASIEIFKKKDGDNKGEPV